MNDRELRLRQRIDQLVDQRDAAQAKLETARTKLDKWRERSYALEHSRDLWRTRARQWQERRLAKIRHRG